MQFIPHLTLNNLTYTFPNSEQPLFDSLNLNVGAQKMGMVGRNGVGKTTLLKLIAGELSASSGTASHSGSLVYVKQEQRADSKQSVADLLGLSEKLSALTRIEKGELREQDFELLQNDWDFFDRIKMLMQQLNLAHIELDRKISTLSGGERTRLALANGFYNPYDIVILDEPTNNLDALSRTALYEQITGFNGCLLVVSHDRELLRLMDCIADLTTKGIDIYGGNYDYYVEAKRNKDLALQHQLDAKLKNLKKSKENIQRRKQQHQKGESKGIQTKKAMIKAKGRVDKIALNAAKGRSEKTNRRITMQAERKLTSLNNEISVVRNQIEHADEFVITMDNTFVPTKKIILEMSDVCFSYDNHSPLINDFNLMIKGPERIAITGHNGCGKSTLLKLILSELQPSRGSIKRGVNELSYFDQHASLLNPEKTIMENFREKNPDIAEAKAWSILAQFKFRKTNVFKKVSQLSGGEKLRALFACVLMSTKPPQLLLIDEPTNHLDFESIEVIEEALRNYQGALIVISHDADFLQNINCTRFLAV